MKKSILLPAIALAFCLPMQSASADDAAKPAPVMNTDVGVPVFATDLPDHPYTVIGQVSVSVRKATVFSKEASQEKIYKTLWKHAKEDHPDADAVINAKYGDSHITALSWGATSASGTVVKFNK